MKRFILKLGKCLIIYIVIFMTILTGISYGYTSAEVSQAAADFAYWILTTYDTSANGGSGKLQYSQGKSGQKGGRNENPFWNTEVYSTYINKEVWYFDCSSFVTACFNYVTGEIICGSSSWPATTSNISENFDYIGSYASNSSEAQPGDIILTIGSHVEIFISAELGSGGAHSSSGGVYLKGDGTVSPSNGGIYRLKESVAASVDELNEEFTSTSISSSSGNSAYTLSNFYFNGIPDGTYSIASSNLWTTLVETIASIADYLIGILTYIIRVVIVGWTSIIDRLFNWTVNTITDTGTEAEDLGISGSDVEETDSSSRITLESLFYGEYDLLDINIFDIEVSE